MRYLVAPDKFKGTMAALEVAEAIASGLRDGDPTAEVDLLPIADGGEGTAKLLAAQLNADTHTVDSFDPLGRRVTAEYFTKGTDAIFDVSEASGLWRVRPTDRAPLRSSTYGSGVIVRHIIESGLQQIFIGLGGSATVDAGLGMAAALGYQFYDHDNRLIEPLPSAFSEIQRIQAPAIACIAKVIALADVETVLTGPEGATWTFGPQKGLTHDEVSALDTNIARLTCLVERDLGTNFSNTPGAGAAGGFGYGVLTFLKGQIMPGFNVVAEKVGLRARMASTDIVITGEGRLDFQTLQGKAPYGVASLAKQLDKPVWAIGGVIEDRSLLAGHFDHLSSLVSDDTTLEQAMKNPKSLLRQRAFELCRNLVGRP